LTPEIPSAESRSLEFNEEHCQTDPSTSEQRKPADMIAMEPNLAIHGGEALKKSKLRRVWKHSLDSSANHIARLSLIDDLDPDKFDPLLCKHYPATDEELSILRRLTDEETVDAKDTAFSDRQMMTKLRTNRFIQWVGNGAGLLKAWRITVNGKALLANAPKPPVIKTGRPVKKKLTKQQLQAIHRRRENKEPLTAILESYPEFKGKYDTFRRQYLNWVNENR
jgi:hypothetical protein